MNRGFGFYFGNAMKSSAKTLWHKGNLIKYFAWVIMELLSPFTVILGAMFSLANIRQAKIAERENTIDIPQSFKVACQAKPFWTMFLAIVLEALIFLAGAILIGIAGGLLGAIGYAVSLFVDTLDPEIIILIFFAPSMLVFVVYSVIMPILMAPTAYVIETNPDIGAADAISICFNTMKSRGKATCFLNCFIPALVEGAILGLGAVIEVVLMLFVSENDPTLYLVLAVLVGIIFFVAFALVAPTFALARKISNKSLFEDIVLDPVNASKRTSGVNIKKCKGVKFDPAEYENELALLFDETYSDRVPLPESPSARRKRQLEERKAAASVDYTKTLLEDDAPYTPAPVKPASDDEDGELITVSDLIRDVETEAPATEEVPAETPAEEPVAPETVEPVEEEKTEAPAEPEPVKEEEPAAEEPAEEPAREEVKAEEPAQEPVKKATKTTATKTTAAKSTATKTAATKSTATKTATTKTAANKTTATKTTAAKTTAAKPAATKTTAAKTTATKTTATKTTAAKSTAAKSTATKSTAAKPAAKTATKATTAKSTTSKSTAKKQ